jgi:hypothetical protein
MEKKKEGAGSGGRRRLIYEKSLGCLTPGAPERLCTHTNCAPGATNASLWGITSLRVRVSAQPTTFLGGEFSRTERGRDACRHLSSARSECGCGGRRHIKLSRTQAAGRRIANCKVAGWCRTAQSRRSLSSQTASCPSVRTAGYGSVIAQGRVDLPSQSKGPQGEFEGWPLV